MNKTLSCFLLLTCLSGCGGGGNDVTTNDINNDDKNAINDIASQNLAIPDNRESDDYKVLFFGNSHIARLPQFINTFISIGIPNKVVKTERSRRSLFLTERLADGESMDLLLSDNWTHIILQAQKYSQSGIVDYPTEAAQTWIKRSKNQGATPILFPEHPHRGDKEEGLRVHLLHKGIAEAQASCVAPVGLAWNKALIVDPTLNMHTTDGNHASTVGAFLTALVFYEVITGHSADLLPYIPSIEVDEITQDLLGQVASETVAANNACEF